jgi:hypothetical protein
MEYRFEFDTVNKILLLRVEGRVTDESFTEGYWAVRKYSTETDASAGIWDLSSVTDFAVSPEFIRRLVDWGPAMPDATKRPRFLVAPAMVGLAISRLFEIAGEHENPLFRIVLSLNEALAALGVQSPHFEALQ